VRLPIDPSADALHFSLGEREIARTKQVAPGVMLDFDSEGRVVGIEMLSISKRASKRDLQKLLFERLGETRG
jgi:uncharacterized protein YuzE